MTLKDDQNPYMISCHHSSTSSSNNNMSYLKTKCKEKLTS